MGTGSKTALELGTKGMFSEGKEKEIPPNLEENFDSTLLVVLEYVLKFLCDPK